MALIEVFYLKEMSSQLPENLIIATSPLSSQIWDV